jgi:hypothetical protein
MFASRYIYVARRDARAAFETLEQTSCLASQSESTRAQAAHPVAGDRWHAFHCDQPTALVQVAVGGAAPSATPPARRP